MGVTPGAASERLIDTMEAYLGYPKWDPHGDPIPAKAQQEYSFRDISLTELPQGKTVVITRVDGDKDTLSYFRQEGLVPGAKLTMGQKNPAAGLVILALGEKSSHPLP